MRTSDNGVEREMTSQERAEYEAWSAQAQAEEARQKAEDEARETARKSALSKLAALGLTEAEIAALLGA